MNLPQELKNITYTHKKGLQSLLKRIFCNGFYRGSGTFDKIFATGLRMHNLLFIRYFLSTISENHSVTGIYFPRMKNHLNHINHSSDNVDIKNEAK